MRLGLVSAKGSPGASTVALAIAALTGGIAVEADPAGGDVECWSGPQGEPGLIRLAGVLRHHSDPAGLLREHAVEVRPGVAVVLAPVGAEQAALTLETLGQGLGLAVRAEFGFVVVDAGRWDRMQGTTRRLEGCDAVGVVLSPTVSSVAHTRALIASLRELIAAPVLGVVVGERGYPPGEVADALGVPIAGVVRWDTRGVQSLLASGDARLWRRSPLARSVRSLVERLEPARVGAAADGG